MTANEIEHIVSTVLIRDCGEELTRQQIKVAAYDIARLIVAELDMQELSAAGQALDK